MLLLLFEAEEEERRRGSWTGEGRRSALTLRRRQHEDVRLTSSSIIIASSSSGFSSPSEVGIGRRGLTSSIGTSSLTLPAVDDSAVSKQYGNQLIVRGIDERTLLTTLIPRSVRAALILRDGSRRRRTWKGEGESRAHFSFALPSSFLPPFETKRFDSLGPSTKGFASLTSSNSILVGLTSS